MNDQRNTPFPEGMATLSECMTLAAERGYTASFSPAELDGDLHITSGDLAYRPAQISIPNFYRFEGASNPDDMSILYLIEATDGTMGTLVDAYGTYADSRISEFVQLVEQMHKVDPA